MHLKCPACGELQPLEEDVYDLDDEHGVVSCEDGPVETFVHKHLAHLADGQYFDVIASVGDC